MRLSDHGAAAYAAMDISDREAQFEYQEKITGLKARTKQNALFALVKGLEGG